MTTMTTLIDALIDQAHVIEDALSKMETADGEALDAVRDLLVSLRGMK